MFGKVKKIAVLFVMCSFFGIGSANASVAVNEPLTDMLNKIRDQLTNTYIAQTLEKINQMCEQWLQYNGSEENSFDCTKTVFSKFLGAMVFQGSNSELQDVSKEATEAVLKPVPTVAELSPEVAKGIEEANSLAREGKHQEAKEKMRATLAGSKSHIEYKNIEAALVINEFETTQNSMSFTNNCINILKEDSSTVMKKLMTTQSNLIDAKQADNALYRKNSGFMDATCGAVNDTIHNVRKGTENLISIMRFHSNMRDEERSYYDFYGQDNGGQIE